MDSAHNEAQSVAAERFIRTLKDKSYRYMTPISKNVCIDKLDDIVNKYNNTYHSTIKMKHVDLKLSAHSDCSEELMTKTLNLKLVIFLEYQNMKTLLQKTLFLSDLKREKNCRNV